jgi:hypothetical protein
MRPIERLLLFVRMDRQGPHSRLHLAAGDSKENLKKGFLVLDISGSLYAPPRPPACPA